MPERRGFRFALEVFFLAALAAALSFTELRPVAVAGLMLLGWVLVGLLEWVTWRGEAHYGRGLPPRYYVPRVSLPEPMPVEQAWYGYPAPDEPDDARRWIASPALVDQEVGAWPVYRMPVEAAPEVSEELALEFDPLQLLAPRVDPPVEEIAAALELTTVLQVTSASVRLERHRIDPLQEPERSRLRRRRSGEGDEHVATVPARPDGRMRPLPPARGD